MRAAPYFLLHSQLLISWKWWVTEALSTEPFIILLQAAHLDHSFTWNILKKFWLESGQNLSSPITKKLSNFSYTAEVNNWDHLQKCLLNLHFPDIFKKIAQADGAFFLFFSYFTLPWSLWKLKARRVSPVKEPHRLFVQLKEDKNGDGSFVNVLKIQPGYGATGTKNTKIWFSICQLLLRLLLFSGST